MASLRGTASASSGNTTVSSVTLTVPSGAAAGDVAVLTVNTGSTRTLTTPTGWTVQDDSPISGGSGNWLLTRVLGSSDAGSTVKLTFSDGGRVAASMRVWAGVTLSGLSLQSVSVKSVSSFAVPSTSVPAGAVFDVSLLTMTSAASAPSVTIPSGYTLANSVATTISSSPNLTGYAAYQLPGSSSTLAGSFTTSVASTGVVYALVLPGGGGAQQPSQPRAQPITSGTLSWPVPDWFKQFMRSGYRLTYTVDASYAGTLVRQGLQPVGGSITDTIKPGVRRTLNLDLAPEAGLYDALAPTGTQLAVTAHVTLTNNVIIDVPMGVYIIDQASLSEGGGKLSITAPDRWALVQRAKFLGPTSSTPGSTVVQQIINLLRDVIGANEAIAVTATSTLTVGALTWDKDRDKAILDLATSIGAWVYCDRNGFFTIADQPRQSSTANWLVDSSPSGVLVTLDRQKARTNTYNVVVVDSSSTTTPAFAAQYVWDSDPNSPTYAGPGSWGPTPPAATSAGPFGQAPYFYSDPNLSDATSALAAGAAILSRTVGSASAVNLTSVPNPAVDAFDAIDVLPPRERADVIRSLERHIADTVTHPLDVSQPQQIQGRSTRTDAYT